MNLPDDRISAVFIVLLLSGTKREGKFDIFFNIFWVLMK